MNKLDSRSATRTNNQLYILQILHMDANYFQQVMTFRTQTMLYGINPGPSIPLSLETHKWMNERWEDIITPPVSLCVLLPCMTRELVLLEMNGGQCHLQLKVK